MARPFTLVALLFLGFCAVGAGPVLGQASSLFTVSGVHVDVTASSTTEAFNKAIAEGRPAAFQILFRRLVRQQDWGRQPNLDAAALQRLARGYTVANERRSTTRYVADVTYMFNPDGVARLLRSAGIAFAQNAPRRILLIPMSPDAEAGPWASALGSRDSVVPFALPGPDDYAALSGLNFETASFADVAQVASRSRANEVALVQSVYANGRMSLNIRRLASGEPATRTTTQVPLQGTVNSTYPTAAQAALGALEDLWKARAAIDFSRRSRLTADLRITGGIGQWGAVQNQLAGVNLVTDVQLVAMTTDVARFNIAHVGTVDQLREALSAARLALSGRAGQWTLASSN